MAEENQKDITDQSPEQLAVEPDLSYEQIDEILNEEDPEFAEKVDAIGKDKTLTLEQIIIDDETVALQFETERWKSGGFLSQISIKILPFLPRLSLKVKAARFIIWAFILANSIRFKNFVYYMATTGRRQALIKIRDKREIWRKQRRQFQNDYWRFSRRRKILWNFSIFLAIGAVAIIFWGVKHGFLPKEPALFINSMSELASDQFEINPEDIEPFYDNSRITQNLLHIQKMVVNIKKSDSSGPNPMAAFDFFVEGYASDTMLEIKQNETKFRDKMMRVVEGFTFDQLESAEGKRELLEALLKELNENLSSGTLKSIKIKTAVIKP